MDTHLLSMVPLACLLSALVFAGFAGERIYTSTRCVSVLGIACTLLGLVLGWLMERFLPGTPSIDERLKFGSLGLEVELLFSSVTALTLLAVALAARDASGKSKTDSGVRQFSHLLSMFILAMCISARGKLAAVLAAVFLR